MSYFEFQEKVEFLHELIKSEYKASPKELANKLQVSLRTYYRILDVIKEKHENVIYDRTLQRYVCIENQALSKE